MRITTTVDFGRDRGQNFGTLFEARDDSGNVVAGAGFVGVYNTRFRHDRHTLQLFVRPRNGTSDYRLERLPRAETRPVLAGCYLFDFDGKVHATSHRGDDVVRPGEGTAAVRAWDTAAGGWRVEPQLTEGVTHSADLTMRVAGKLLECKDSRVHYDGKLILDKPTGGFYHHFYFAMGHLVFFHNHAEGTPSFSRMIACPWDPYDNQPLDLTRAITQDLEVPGERSFAIGQHNNSVIESTNHGGVYRFDGKMWRVLRRRVIGTSFQIYSMLNWRDRFWMPQYPSGRILELVGDEIHELPDAPPTPPGVSTFAREAQSAVIYGGDAYVGVWPWGELWRHSGNDGSWRMLQRLFSYPEPRADFDHPWEQEVRAYAKAHGTDERINGWGQRVTSLVAMGESLYISTSAYGPWPRDTRFDFLTDQVWEEYGRVYRLTVPGVISAPIRWKNGPTTLTFTVADGRIAMEQDEELLIEAASPTVRDDWRITWADGIFGLLGGRLTASNADVHVRSAK